MREIAHLYVELARSKASLCGSGLFPGANGELSAVGERGACVIGGYILLLLLLWHKLFQILILL